MPIGSDKGFIVKPGFNPLATQTSEVTAGGLWTWGQNSSGELGVGNTTYYSSPVQVGALTTWDQAVAGLLTTLAIKENTLWAWGNGGSGRLGQGNTTDYSSPVQVGALTNWLKVSASAYGNSVGCLKTDGTIWMWGNGYGGALGQGNTTSMSSPVQVGSETYWSDFNAGSNPATGGSLAQVVSAPTCTGEE